MANSGVPVFSQIGSFFGAVPDLANSGNGDNANKPPGVATPSDAETAAAIRKNQEDVNRQAGQGEAANMLTRNRPGLGSDGWSTDPNTYARSVLIGS
jgi:hypothetical protein